MPLIKSSGIILNSRPMGEYDRIVGIFTEDIGRIDGIAKGARSFKNRFGGSLEPFTHCRLGLFRKRHGSLYRIESADIVNSFSQVRKDLDLILHSSSMVDVLRKITPLEDPSKPIFTLLLRSLDRISAGEHIDNVLFFYQIQILHLSGLGLRFDGCVKCNRKVTDFSRTISIAEGGLVCPACINKTGGGGILASGGTIAVMQRWQTMVSSHINRYRLAESMKNEIRGILDLQLGHVTGKKLIDIRRYVTR